MTDYFLPTKLLGSDTVVPAQISLDIAVNLQTGEVFHSVVTGVSRNKTPFPVGDTVFIMRHSDPVTFTINSDGHRYSETRGWLSSNGCLSQGQAKRLEEICREKGLRFPKVSGYNPDKIRPKERKKQGLRALCRNNDYILNSSPR